MSFHLEVRRGLAAHHEAKAFIEPARRAVRAGELAGGTGTPRTFASWIMSRMTAEPIPWRWNPGKQLDLAHEDLHALIQHLKEPGIHAVADDDLVSPRRELLLESLVLGRLVPTPRRRDILLHDLSAHRPEEDAIIFPTVSKGELAHRPAFPRAPRHLKILRQLNDCPIRARGAGVRASGRHKSQGFVKPLDSSVALRDPKTNTLLAELRRKSRAPFISARPMPRCRHDAPHPHPTHERIPIAVTAAIAAIAAPVSHEEHSDGLRADSRDEHRTIDG